MNTHRLEELLQLACNRHAVPVELEPTGDQKTLEAKVDFEIGFRAFHRAHPKRPADRLTLERTQAQS